MLLAVIALIYLVGVHFHLIEPFPHTSSFFEAGRLYPNYLILRSGGIQSCPIIFLMILMQYYYINGIYRKINFSSPKYSRKSACLFILGFVGSLLLVMSIASLDSLDTYNEKL